MTLPEADGSPPPSVFTPVPDAPPVARPPADGLPLALTLGLAVLAYLLTRGTGALGLNVPLIAGALLGSSLLVLRRRGQPVRRSALALLALGLLCALGLALRDGPLMTGLNLLGLFAALSLGAAYLRFPGLTRVGVGGVLLAALWAWLRGLYGLFASGLRFPWARLRPQGLTRRLRTDRSRRVLTGVLLTLPLLLVFGALLSGADARFGALFSRLFAWKLPNWNPDDLAFALVQLVFWAFLLGGPVYAALLATRAAPEVRAAHTPRLGLTELGLPLLGVSLLFCVYLALQAETFFGHRLQGGLTYSEYVRRGFGELTAVAALTLVVLLLAHTLLRRELRAGLPYRLLSLAVLLPLSLLIVSAYGRLSLYVGAYGLSEIRVLGGVFLAWVTLSLLAYTVLLWRNGLERFAYFSLISGLALIVGLDGLNPGRLIAVTNLSRAVSAGPDQGAQAINLVELTNLGADAAPVIVARLSTTKPDIETLCDLARFLPAEPPDWRVWNLARARAAALVQRLEKVNPLVVHWENCQAEFND